ncbi:UNC-like C-terminal-domain-containing protein [Cytidiella melzeri]|nr:UNC-like C-terminal-domain-containing protein [Cytidiella melzeri]
MRPQSLLALSFVVPVLSLPSTPNDLFHHIALRVPKQDDGPVCCLRPLSPPESTEDDVLLSFEEWKEKQMASVLKEHPVAPAHTLPGSSLGATAVQAMNASAEATAHPALLGKAQNTQPVEVVEALVPDAPYFRIPLTDRFNYASTDCSARVHTTHKSAKSPSSILSSKRDRYMLSPCNEEKQYVVVELCDDIRIDTVQLANYEFFSGVFKDFTVSVAKTYTEGWVVAGTYRAKNTRGVQSFHPPTTLGDFYRFIRIDFHSHYGGEYYCPLSLLRVYGLTHLEHWKWDLWESESKAKRAPENSAAQVEVLPARPQPVQRTEAYFAATIAEHPVTLTENVSAGQVNNAVSPGHTESKARTELSASISSLSTAHVQPADAHGETTGAEHSDSVPSVTPNTDASSSAAASVQISDGSPSSNLPQSSSELDTSYDSERQPITNSLYNTISLSAAPSSHSVSLSLSASSLSAQASPSSSHFHVISSVSADQPPHYNRSSSSTASATLSQSLSVAAPAHSSSGESIYRTIMNRLTALETNTSLYARFVEDHTANVREMLRKLSEEVGRVEGLGKAQAQMYQRSVGQFEQQQRRIELEHSELLQLVSRLTDEVVLEKRVGIAQLCLLLAVLVFMALTRGSRHEPVRVRGSEDGSVRSRTSSLRGWGRRTLSISGDWMNRFKSRSASPPSTRPVHGSPTEPDKPTELVVRTESSLGVQASDNVPRKRAHPASGGRKLGIIVHPRTPTTSKNYAPRLHSPVNVPTTPTRVAPKTAPIAQMGPRDRPLFQRAHSSGISQSFSMGMIPPGPKSAKHWARTAHLHEVKNVGGRKQSGGAGPFVPPDFFSQVSATTGAPGRPVRAEEGEGGLVEFAGGPVAKSLVRWPVGTSPTREDRDAISMHRGRTSKEDVSEGDAWVDTDADDSGSEFSAGRPKNAGNHD